MANDEVPLKLNVSGTVAKAIDAFQLEHGLKSRSATVRHLLETALQVRKPARPRVQDGSDKCRHPIARRIGTGCGQCGENLK